MERRQKRGGRPERTLGVKADQPLREAIDARGYLSVKGCFVARGEAQWAQRAARKDDRSGGLGRLACGEGGFNYGGLVRY